MGLGYWLMEKLIYDEDSGQLLTHNTWVITHLLLIVADEGATPSACIMTCVEVLWYTAVVYIIIIL